MSERFSERGRAVVVLAEDEARALEHNYIGPEHILLALLRERNGLAARVLNALGVTHEESRALVVRIVGRGDGVKTGMIPLTPGAKRVLEGALREALSLGHDYIGTEHLLLSLVRETGGVAEAILGSHGATGNQVRNEIVRILSRPGRALSTAEEAVAVATGSSEISIATGETHVFVGRELLRVIAVAERLAPDVVVTSVELYADGLIVRWLHLDARLQHDVAVHVRDDSGTSYVRGPGGSMGRHNVVRGETAFTPRVPASATTLEVLAVDGSLSVPLRRRD